MRTFTIAVIAGDGVGKEILPPAKRVLEQIGRKHQVSFAFQDFDWGADHFFQWGRMMPAGAIDLLQPCDAILLGAIGHPDIPDHTTLNGLLLPIRRSFDQYANVRPAFLYPGVQSPLAGKIGGDIDFILWDMVQNEFLNESSDLAEMVQRDLLSNRAVPCMLHLYLDAHLELLGVDLGRLRPGLAA